MKIAVSATSDNLEAEIDPRFGRCRYFLIVNPDTLEFESIDNFNAPAGGAGITAAQMIAGKGVEAVLTGNCGPNAYQVLTPAGIKVITGVNGNVREAVARYKSGAYTAATQANVPDHFGGGGRGGGGFGRGRQGLA